MSSSDRDNHAAGPAHFVCWGEVIWDIFPDRRMLGGAPANVAYHLAALGERVSLVSRVGDDPAGREARAALAGCGVGVDPVQIDPTRPTGWVEVSFDDCHGEGDGGGDGREPRYRLIPDCAWEHIAVDEPAERALGGAAAFCYGTLSQRASSVEFDRALPLLPDDCLRVCDVNLRPRSIAFEVLRAALAAADVVKVNEEEAAEMADLVGVGVGDLAAWLHGELGVRLVALTFGPAGCRLIAPTESVEHGGFPISIADGQAADNVGAGDGFTAVLTKLLVAGRPLGFIGEASNRYGAYIASQRGATPAIEPGLVAAICRGPASGV